MACRVFRQSSAILKTMLRVHFGGIMIKVTNKKRVTTIFIVCNTRNELQIKFQLQVFMRL